MGNCMRYGSASVTSSPTTASHIDAGVPHTTSKNTKSFKTSNLLSSKSLFLVSSGDESYPDGRILATSNLRRFRFKELKTATRNFKPENLLGEGEFGEVYKGWLRRKLHPQRRGGGTAVAIKKLKPRNKRRVTESEIDFLGRLSHPNLVKLLGYCSEDSELLLVYEFMQRGSLENHLFGKGSVVQPLPWELRIKIAIGVARGVIFLHASGGRVIYGDMTAANILLDGVYNAKIIDFGLAHLGPSSSQRQIAPRIMGPFGYAAPEYVATGQLYVNSEVYCFGVVLAELLTGFRALENRCSNGKQTLADWIKPYLLDKIKLQTIMDPTLDRKYPPKAVVETAKLVLSCLGQNPRTRPSMKEALETLENIQAIGKAQKETRKKLARCSRQSPLAICHQFH